MTIKYSDMSPEQKAARIAANKRWRAKKIACDPSFVDTYNQRQREYHKRYMSSPETYIKRKLNRLKASAKSRGLEFNLTAEDLVIPDKCPIFNEPFNWDDDKSPMRPSVDRVDTSKGYIKGNVRVISMKANACKSDLTIDQIRRLLEYCLS